MQAEPQVRVCAVLNDMYENLRSMRNIDLNDHEFCKQVKSCQINFRFADLIFDCFCGCFPDSQLANHGLRFVHSNRTLLRDCYADATNPISPKPRWPQDAAEYVIIELVAKPKTTAQKVYDRVLLSVIIGFVSYFSQYACVFCSTLYFICRLICTKLNDRLTEDNRFIVFKDFVKLIKARLSQIRFVCFEFDHASVVFFSNLI
jgi:hypothetical protein